MYKDKKTNNIKTVKAKVLMSARTPSNDGFNTFVKLLETNEEYLLFSDFQLPDNATVDVSFTKNDIDIHIKNANDFNMFNMFSKAAKLRYAGIASIGIGLLSIIIKTDNASSIILGLSLIAAMLIAFAIVKKSQKIKMNFENDKVNNEIIELPGRKVWELNDKQDIILFNDGKEDQLVIMQTQGLNMREQTTLMFHKRSNTVLNIDEKQIIKTNRTALIVGILCSIAAIVVFIK
jgi:hypothetical protein